MVPLGLRALSNSHTVGNREQSDRGLMFPGGETEAKRDESILQWQCCVWGGAGCGPQCLILELELPGSTGDSGVLART